MTDVRDGELVLDAETRAQGREHRSETRLWLRLLTCTTMIEGEIRTRLRQRFDMTLPRFDLMAQLERMPDGMTLGELSRRMMVSNGNITGTTFSTSTTGTSQNAVLVVQLLYLWPTVTGPLGLNLGTTAAGNRILTATEVIDTEAFPCPSGVSSC